jgi:hypothetical protein
MTDNQRLRLARRVGNTAKGVVMRKKKRKDMTP